MESIFRSKYRELTDGEKVLLDFIKEKASSLYTEIDNVQDPRYKALAKTALEECVMWAVKGVTA